MTMTRDRELWACASLLIEHHGEGAGFKAAQRSDELLAAGVHDGAAAWRLLVDRINQLQAPPSGLAN